METWLVSDRTEACGETMIAVVSINESRTDHCDQMRLSNLMLMLRRDTSDTGNIPHLVSRPEQITTSVRKTTHEKGLPRRVSQQWRSVNAAARLPTTVLAERRCSETRYGKGVQRVIHRLSTTLEGLSLLKISCPARQRILRRARLQGKTWTEK